MPEFLSALEGLTLKTRRATIVAYEFDVTGSGRQNSKIGISSRRRERAEGVDGGPTPEALPSEYTASKPCTTRSPMRS